MVVNSLTLFSSFSTSASGWRSSRAAISEFGPSSRSASPKLLVNTLRLNILASWKLEIALKLIGKLGAIERPWSGHGLVVNTEVSLGNPAEMEITKKLTSTVDSTVDLAQ